MEAQRFLKVSLVFIALGVIAPQVQAQSDSERAAARAAGVQGMAAYKAKQWEQAVAHFTKAQSIVNAPTHLLYIARAEAAQGHLVEANEAYIKLSLMELPANASSAFIAAQEAGKTEQQNVAERLPSVTLSVASGRQPTALRIDGKTSPIALLGVSMPVNPGKHTFQLQVDGAWGPEMQADIAEASHATVTLELPKQTSAQPSMEVNPPLTAQAPAPMGVAPSPRTPSSNASSYRYLSYVALGVGVIGVGAGTYFAVQRSAKNSDATTAYDRFRNLGCLDAASTACRSQAVRIHDLDTAAARAGSMAWAGYALGAVGLGVGATLFVLTRPHSSEKPPTATVSARASLSGFDILGEF